MYHAQVYSDKLVKRALKHRDNGNNREQVVALLQGEFPEVADRLNPKVLSDIYTRHRIRNTPKTTEVVAWADLDAVVKQKVYAAGRKYYDQKYRWSAIMECVGKDFPNIGLPPVQLFSRWALDNTKETKEPTKTATNKDVPNFTLTISNCGSIHFEKKVAASEAKSIVLSALGIL